MALPVPAFDSLPLVNFRTGVDISSRLQQLSLQLPGVLLEKLPQLWAFTQERAREGNEPRVNRKREGKVVRRPCISRLQVRQAQGWNLGTLSSSTSSLPA